ncbi:MAG: BatA domain-containing protein [Bacteroidota bacterium]
MTFLNPLVLLGLLAASIPIILHLLNLRKLRTIEFSTITFLKELQKSKMRRIKIRQWLLLALRTLLIILVVLAFARPAIKGTIPGAIGTHAHTTVVLLLDDSFSLSVSDEHGQRWKRAKEFALHLVDILQEGDEAFLVKWSEALQEPQDSPTHNFSALRVRIENSEYSFKRTSIDEAFGVASKLLSTTTNVNREVYVISDFQQTAFESESERKEPETLFEQNVRFFLLPVGDRLLQNQGITSVEVVSTIFEKERPVQLRTTVKNYSSTALTNSLVSAYFDGNRVMQKGVDLQVGQQAAVDLAVVPRRTGILHGTIRLEDDVLEMDNIRFFTVTVPDRIDVLVIQTSPGDSRFIRAALEAADRERSSLFRLDQVSRRDLRTTNITAYDLIVAASVNDLSRSDLTRIRQFLESGGGLIFFPGDDFEVTKYRELWKDILGFPPLSGIRGDPSDRSAYRSFETIDFEHPIFDGVFGSEGVTSRRKVVDSPRIYASVRYQPGPQMHRVITLSDGSPFLLTQKIGSGTIILMSVPPTLEWSDLPVKGIFAPLINRSVLFAAARGEHEEGVLVGTPATIRIPGHQLPAETSALILRRPDGTEHLLRPLLPTFPGGTAKVHVDDTPVAGVYELYAGNQYLRAFLVNVDPLESDLRFIEEEKLKKFWNRYGVSPSAVRRVDLKENLERTVLESRFGVELWKYVLGLALAVAVAEMVIAREKKEKST